MSQVADSVTAKIIQADMMGKKYTLEPFTNTSVALLDDDRTLLQGQLSKEANFKKDFYMKDGGFTLISRHTAGHMDVEYVVVQSSQCNQNVDALRNQVIYTVIFTALFIIIISVFLSYMFLRPLRDKMQEIEQFVKDTTHELNTPITALMMSTSRLKAKKLYDEKIAKNISISTKQLYDIYASLSFLSFDNKSEEAEVIAFDKVVQDDITYMSELLERKNITIIEEIASCSLTIAPTKAKMLINNLLTNAVKYSTPNTTIHIKLDKDSFVIEDEGIGIAEDKLDEIFKRFVRANSYAGGFGIGLNIVESIVKEYGFEISIESTLGKGTRVRVDFS